MAAYFECSSCKSITPISSTPPRCPVCGKASGMVVSRAARPRTPSTLAVPEGRKLDTPA